MKKYNRVPMKMVQCWRIQNNANGAGYTNDLPSSRWAIFFLLEFLNLYYKEKLKLYFKFNFLILY